MLVHRPLVDSKARPTRQRGAVLVEFGFIAFLMYLLLAVTVDFGRLFFTAQAAQSAANVAAREIGVIELPPDMTLEQALQDPQVQARVYQPEHLVIDLDNIPLGMTLSQFYDTLPVLNQMLRPLMIFDTTGGRRLLRYPGALLGDPTTPSGFTVGIPFVEGRDAQGVETIRWLPVLEEIRNSNFPLESPFSETTPAAMPQRGLVAIRINYPYQAAMLVGHRSGATATTPNMANHNEADPGSVVELNSAPGTVLGDTGEAHPYGGQYGLGRMKAYGKDVRPFRKVMSFPAIFRRQVFD
jgi:hypothetical protein